MRSAHVLLLCMLGAVLLSSVLCSHANGPENCCFKFYPRRLSKDKIVSYSMTDERCSMIGVVLLTQKSKKVCVDRNLSWVQGIMRHVDQKSF